MEFQSEKGMRSKVKSRTEKVSLENYIDFVLSNKQIDLTVNFLNQIINMHGFKKIHKVQKKVLTDAVNTLDLVDPSRSTLNDNVSCFAFVTLEDVILDLCDLNWQECCVTSIQTLNSWKHCGVVSGGAPDPIKSKASDPIGVADVYGGEGSTSSCVVGSEYSGLERRSGAGKLVPKRKRSNLRKGGVGGCPSGCVSVGSFGSC
ncbi:hypothetical protein RGQ29_028050 [Quercus rubra]|uniref:DUF7787 domain-containing protein n=1 Tax=Quercus rubra TaxID=3512 RepID=A0AAN7EQU0_QUERU|nr:hypothetical protein RGQ29_028050 [Quercus rubra]